MVDLRAANAGSQVVRTRPRAHLAAMGEGQAMPDEDYGDVATDDGARADKLRANVEGALVDVKATSRSLAEMKDLPRVDGPEGEADPKSNINPTGAHSVGRCMIGRAVTTVGKSRRCSRDLVATAIGDGRDRAVEGDPAQKVHRFMFGTAVTTRARSRGPLRIALRPGLAMTGVGDGRVRAVDGERLQWRRPSRSAKESDWSNSVTQCGINRRLHLRVWSITVSLLGTQTPSWRSAKAAGRGRALK